jgi:hypothetical protein
LGDDCAALANGTHYECTGHQLACVQNSPDMQMNYLPGLKYVIVSHGFDVELRTHCFAGVSMFGGLSSQMASGSEAASFILLELWRFDREQWTPMLILAYPNRLPMIYHKSERFLKR